MGENKLELWKERLSESEAAVGKELKRMDEREKLYNGQRKLRPLVQGDTQKNGDWRETSHVRNIIFENIESQISSAIPSPKVTPRRRKDERLASVIEHWLRNELDRMPFETMNDMAERTCPVQGGVGWMVEWDNQGGNWESMGENLVSQIHPKQFRPQPGVYTSIRDMDWFIVAIPTTKETVRRRYGKDVADEGERDPSVRSVDESTADDMVTEYVGFARNDAGGIDRYAWVNDVELEDLENYQARRLPVCEDCGEVKPQNEEENSPYGKGRCPKCGGKFVTRERMYEFLTEPIVTRAGTRLTPGMGIDENGVSVSVPVAVPYYRPNVYPVILQKSVSVYGQLLGNSDVDMIEDQQNTVNRLEQKIIDRLMKAGTRITLPGKMLNRSPEDGEAWFLEGPDEKEMIGLYDFSGNLSYELAYLSQVYEEARQILGITDSFQGRKDATATSGKAKEFAAAQSAGRLESKRQMKNAAYAALFELMFKYALAYLDQPVEVRFKDVNGDTQYEEFNRYDFLEQDEAGEWHWNDQFLFSCDTTAPLASNREALWNEVRQNLQAGMFGNPQETQTLILAWSKLEELHYPGAAGTKQFLEQRAQEEQAAMEQQDAQTSQGGQKLPPEIQQAIERQAQQDAMRAALGGGR